MRSSCSAMRLVLRASVSASSRLRSLDRPPGSPIIPVAPPASAIALCPASANLRSTSRPIRLPTCSESALGSQP